MQNQLLYSIKDSLGHGRYGRVYKVNKDGAIFAAKVLPKHRIDVSEIRNKDMIKREIANHKKVSGHPNIVEHIEVIEDWGNFYIIQEYCEKGDLEKYIEKNILSLDKVQTILRSSISGLQCCHNNGFLYGDLKPSNILITHDDKYKLCDFGSTDNAKDLYSGTSSVRGTPIFIAPESLVYRKDHGFISDMWSLGILGYYLISRRYPYDIDCTYKEIVQQVAYKEIEYSGMPSLLAQDFLKKCLQADMHKRLTPANALQHPFLTF